MTRPNKKGRKTKLTPEFIEAAVKILKLGNYDHVAFTQLGIDKSTWYAWLAKGEKAESGIFKDFSDAIQKAKTHAEYHALAEILKAGQNPKNWAANAWFLERKYPDNWGKRERIMQEITGKDGGPVATRFENPDLSRLSTDELEFYHTITKKIYPRADDDNPSDEG